MKTLLSRTSLLAAMLLLPGCASLAQDPEPYRNVNYSGEELDNLVAPVALYPDALLAQILVAATFPDQIAVAQRYVRERGTRNIDDQGWDISVKAVAYYPPILNMLANDDDWTIALGQAYASQSGDVMDAVQRLREMAREQGNLVSTREHVVSEDRGRIIIVPANPQVIYVPTYDPAIVYVRPIWSFGFHTGYFSFGIGFPIGSWLVYDVDWWGHRVYYDGWYGDGWRYNARRYFVVAPIYHRPRYSVVNININIFNRRPNYINLDRRYRYVRRNVEWERHDRGGRYADRDGYRGDDRRGPYDGTSRDGDRRNGDDRSGPVGVDRNGRDGRDGRNGGNDQIGGRTATFDDYRPDRGGRTGTDARDSDPPVDRSGFGVIEKGRSVETRSNGNSRADNGSRSNGGGSDYRGSRPDVPVFTSQPRANERSSKANGNGGGRTQSQNARGSYRPEAPVFSAPSRQVERKSNGGGNRPPSPEYRSAPRSNPTFSAPQRSVERKSSGGGGGGGGMQSSRPTTRSAPSVSRPPSSGGGGGKVRQSGGASSSNRSGGGKGRKQ